MDSQPAFSSELVACIATASAHYRLDPRIAFDRLKNRAENEASGDAAGHFRVTSSEMDLAGINHDVRSRVTSDACLNATVAVIAESQHERTVASASTQGARGTSTPSSVGVQVSASTTPVRLPRLDGEGEACVDAAANAYSIPNPVFRAVLKTEGGWQGLKKRNPNGSYDLGPGQINTIHLPALSKFGITEQMLVHDVCLNVHVAAYRLRMEVERVKDLWRGVGNYHSRTPHLHEAYLGRVRRNMSGAR